MAKQVAKMTDQEIENDETLQMAVTLDRFHGYVSAPYEGREMGGDEYPLGALTDARLIREWLDKMIPELVDEARMNGGSWQEVGDALGISRQAAWERFGK